MRFLLFLLLLAITPIRSFASDIRTVAELVTPALATAKTDFKRALLLRDQIHRAHDPASGLPSATTAELSDAAAAYRMSVLEDTRSNACNGKAILFIAVTGSMPGSCSSIQPRKSAQWFGAMRVSM